MNTTKLWFKLLIALDHLLNVILLGEVGTCLSTRAYVEANLASKSAKWKKVEAFIDKLMRQEKHCEISYRWEVVRKHKWLALHKRLEREA